MRKRYLLPIIFPVAYLAAAVILIFNSGAGHDWGTGALLILSLPLGVLGFLLEWLLPHSGLIVLFPLFGFLQYIYIGYFVGSWLDGRSVSR
jgi:hypothetical protein